MKKEISIACDRNTPIIPVRHGLTHAEFIKRAPGLNLAMGAIVDIDSVEKELEDFLTRIEKALASNGIFPTASGDLVAAEPETALKTEREKVPPPEGPQKEQTSEPEDSAKTSVTPPHGPETAEEPTSKETKPLTREDLFACLSGSENTSKTIPSKTRTRKSTP